MRHGQAGDAPADHDRPLSERGRNDSLHMALWLRAQAWLPDIILYSSALRTRQTAEWISDTLGNDAPLKADPQLYLAPPQTLLNVIKEQGGQADTLMLIAHNPGLESLITHLSGQLRPVSPATIALFESRQKDWQLSPHTTRLIDIKQPNQLTD